LDPRICDARVLLFRGSKHSCVQSQSGQSCVYLFYLPFLFLLGFHPRFPQKIGVSSCYTDWGAVQILFGLRNNFSPPAIMRHTVWPIRPPKKTLVN
jgi:hypothetical protein